MDGRPSETIDQSKSSDMTGIIDADPRTIVAVSVIRDVTNRAIEVQSQLTQKLLEVNRHCLEQMQLSSTEAWELFWKINTTPSISERLEACQAWTKAVAERGATNTNYLLEATRSLSEIEMKVLKRPSIGDEDSKRAA
jgi:hypothetical protein